MHTREKQVPQKKILILNPNLLQQYLYLVIQHDVSYVSYYHVDFLTRLVISCSSIHYLIPNTSLHVTAASTPFTELLQDKVMIALKNQLQLSYHFIMSHSISFHTLRKQYTKRSNTQNCGCRYVYSVCMLREHGRSKNNFQERVPSFHHVGSEDQAQVTGFDEESFPAEPFHHPTFIVLKKGYLDFSNIKRFELVQFTISTKKMPSSYENAFDVGVF